MLSCLITLVMSGAPWLPGEVLELEVGEERVLRIPGIQRVAVSGTFGYDVKLVRDELMVIGLAVTKSTLLVWTSQGERFAIEFAVVAKRVRSRSVPVTTSRRQVAAADGGRSGSLEVFEFPAELVDVREEGRADGGVHFVGTDKNGAKYDLVLTPRP